MPVPRWEGSIWRLSCLRLPLVSAGPPVGALTVCRHQPLLKNSLVLSLLQLLHEMGIT